MRINVKLRLFILPEIDEDANSLFARQMVSLELEITQKIPH